MAGSARRPSSVQAVRAELERQTRYQPEIERAGLDELAAVLTRRLVDGDMRAHAALDRLESSSPRQPLVHLYAFAMRREAGQHVEARRSLDLLLELDPGDPMASQLDAFERGETLTPAPEEVRLANIAKFAGTALLANPYSLAVGVLFETIRRQRSARVLDIGVGSGAQMERLLELLSSLPHDVRHLEIVALDHMPEFLDRAQARIEAAAAATGGVEVSYEPVEGKVEALDEAALRSLAARPLDAANATIALHEVAGERKLAALQNLRRMAPRRLVISEWNYCLENVLATTSTQFVFNVRSVAAAMVSALRAGCTIEESRAVVGDWLSQGSGQLTCPSGQRQECFLQIATWKALLEHCRFEVGSVDRRWLSHAAEPGHVAVAEGGWYLKASNYQGATPIALLIATAGR